MNSNSINAGRHFNEQQSNGVGNMMASIWAYKTFAVIKLDLKLLMHWIQMEEVEEADEYQDLETYNFWLDGFPEFV